MTQESANRDVCLSPMKNKICRQRRKIHSLARVGWIVGVLIVATMVSASLSEASEQGIIGGHNDPLNNAATEYNTIAGGSTWNATANNRRQVVSTPGTLKNLFVELSAAPGSRN